MGRLRYAVIVSADGFVNDASGDFSWAMPSEEVHAYVNDMERSIGAHIYGRRLYEVMKVWEDWPAEGHESDEPAVVHDYAAIWRPARKIVVSSTLSEVTTPLTELRRSLSVDDLRELKESAAADLSIGGPTLAATALRAGLVDDITLIAVPAIVGSGTPAFADGVRLNLELVSSRTFDNGTVITHYRTAV